MKFSTATLLVSVALLTGCASSNSSPDSADAKLTTESRWWDPLSYHWSSALPWNWFGSTLKVTDQGVGGLTASTKMHSSQLQRELADKYQLRPGMGTHQGQIIDYWQALRDEKPLLTLYGDHTLTRIEITDPEVEGPNGIKLGTRFEQSFKQAYGNCQMSDENSVVECSVPNNPHLTYQYQGEFHGPQGLMPDDQILKNWKLSRIIWQAKARWL